MQDDEELYDIKRHPILISPNTIILLTRFSGNRGFNDLWTFEYEDHHAGMVEAGAEFVRQLGDFWTPAFMMALRDQITLKLKEHDTEFGTDFANRMGEYSDGK